jgi:hypothetical protein
MAPGLLMGALQIGWCWMDDGPRGHLQCHNWLNR